ncbi:DNA methyltransferase [uncultured Draconibacterium sp.]|uniref:Eco57I restriction-modification methylase domain-containing protein n=1 Tax=uncultured Draconibacterium sp. TaxID=1573823 RepID=UPI003217CEBC
MQYSAINIQGNIVSSEILEKIRIEDIKYQTQGDFGLDKNTSIRDEIGIAWAAARAHWTAFKLRRERLKENDTGTSETRQGWMLPFLRELGYDLDKSGAEIINNKSYAISHRATNRDGFPVHIVGIQQSLDKRADSGGTRLSPHALIQEYLNNHEHLYALVTNGQFLRLLRDATRLSRLSYLEFDLERIMEEDLFAEFALLYRVLHVTRMPEKQDDGEDSTIEFYHQEALDSGSRIREKLSQAVEQSLKELANGLLKHPDNDKLRDETTNGRITPNQFYLYLLRLVYRILFLLVIEERHLIYPEKRNEETNKKRNIYYKFYSINRLTKLAEKQIYVDPQKTDLWKSLLVTFKLFENSFFGDKLGIKPLGSGLFSPDALGNLSLQNLNNGTLLKVLQLLVTFENETLQRTRVNYADLDVEEFGSVYEGLLEYDPAISEIDGQPTFSFVKGEGRSSSGSHYTPEELVKPLIKHSLDYIIEERLKNPEKYTSSTNSFSPPRGEMSAGQRGEHAQAQETALLSITVCDVACGSGHILLSAARKIATELASIREGAEQPSPAYYRIASRDVIKSCIYGVDYNPLAVELCKVALWLEAHNPGEPLNFLDHHIKCGNSIVGLAHREELEKGIASEAFKTLPGDEKDFAKTLRDQNNRELKERKAKEVQLKAEFEKTTNNSVQEAMAEYKTFNKLPETTPLEIEQKQKAYDKFINGKGYSFLKAMADTQTAQFFTPKTTDNKNALMTDAEFRLILSGWQGWQDRKVSNAVVVAQQKRFFHWFIEFPTVMQNGGFDCILGNPPFLGGKRISVKYGDKFLNYIKKYYAPAIGGLDIVAYFFRRNYKLIKTLGYQSLISTNTISQGDTRVGGLVEIESNGGVINHAVSSMKWPGLAAVEVALITIHKGPWLRNFVLNQKIVTRITSYLDDSDFIGDPYPLNSNDNKGFVGSYLWGKGFLLDPLRAKQLIAEDTTSEEVLFPYLNGSDLNNQIDQSPTRWAINFFDWSESKAKKYSNCYAIVHDLVKAERANVKRKIYRENWWLYAEKAVNLYNSVQNFNKVIVVARTSKTLAFEVTNKEQVFSANVTVFALSHFSDFAILQSNVHHGWIWKYCTTMKTDPIYAPVDVFQPFPFPTRLLSHIENKMASIGELYHSSRQQLMSNIQLGLTKTYNAFHAPEIKASIKTEDLTGKNNKEVTKQYSKETWNLWNHLQKTEETCSWEEAVAGIEELRRLHVEMDNAVLEAYGWQVDSEKWGKAINLNHNFYEVDYLPENDRIRYTISPEARKEVLKRLLLLNHERYEEEIKQGLHKKKDVEKFYEQKGVEMPQDVVFSDKKASAYKTKSKAAKVKEAKSGYGQQNLFGEAAEPKSEKKSKAPHAVIDRSFREISWHHNSKNFKVTIRNASGQEFHYHVLPEAQRGKFTGNFKQIKPNSPMADNIIGKQEGDSFEFGGGEYRILRIEM